jgi:DNA repair ATPase RecN
MYSRWDFKKLLNMSQAVDSKLEHITTVYDSFQEIDVKLRGFEDLFKNVAEKSQRLEKKESIMEATIDAVDKNFQMLQKLEKGFGKLSEDADVIPMRLNEVESRFKKINMEKGEADRVIEKLGSLSKIMDDIEERMEKLQKAREWLAGTETRLNESVKKADDNVALLGMLLEKEPKGKKSQKGAPSMDKREMVVKLAHQGWTSDKIAQATDLSISEVELILDMPKK